jgi:hypothetical protein
VRAVVSIDQMQAQAESTSRTWDMVRRGQARELQESVGLLTQNCCLMLLPIGPDVRRRSLAEAPGGRYIRITERVGVRHRPEVDECPRR